MQDFELESRLMEGNMEGLILTDTANELALDIGNVHSQLGPKTSVIRCENISSFASKLQEAPECAKFVVCAAFSDLVCNASERISALETIKTAFQHAQTLKDVRPTITLIMAPPLYRSSPSWYDESYPEILSSFEKEARQHSGLITVSQESLSKNDLESDGVHIKSELKKKYSDDLIAKISKILQQEEQGGINIVGILKKFKKYIMSGAAALFVVIIILIIIFSVGHQDVIEPNHCFNDSFKPLFYNNGTVFLKYKFIEKLSIFDDAVEECKKMNSTLWEVLGGKNEWIAVMEVVKAEGLQSLWINVQPLEDCPGGDQRCRVEESKQGHGLKVKWPSTGEVSTYSRLTHEVTLEKHRCISAKQSGNTPIDEAEWGLDNCGFNTLNGICIKRDCQPSN